MACGHKHQRFRERLCSDHLCRGILAAHRCAQLLAHRFAGPQRAQLGDLQKLTEYQSVQLGGHICAGQQRIQLVCRLTQQLHTSDTLQALLTASGHRSCKQAHDESRKYQLTRGELW